MNYNIFYQICGNLSRNKYSVRKYIYDSNNRICKTEYYTYSKSNMEKLKKELVNYNYEIIDSNNFINIDHPNNLIFI